MQAIPLDLHDAGDPARRRTVVSVAASHLDAAVEVHRSFAVLVVAKTVPVAVASATVSLSANHSCDLPLSGAVNARNRPSVLPSDRGMTCASARVSKR